MRTLVLANNEAAPEAANVWMAIQCADFGLPEMASYQITSCLVEAVNNAVSHKLPGHDGQISVKLYTNASCLVLQIRDSGPSAEHKLRTTILESDAIGGRGWFIINQWMDVVRYKRLNIYNIVTMARSLSRD